MEHEREGLTPEPLNPVLMARVVGRHGGWIELEAVSGIATAAGAGRLFVQVSPASGWREGDRVTLECRNVAAWGREGTEGGRL